MEIDLEAANAAWPNFGVFYSCLKDHPALGASTPVEDTEAILAAVELSPEQSTQPVPSVPSAPSTPSVQSEITGDSSDEEEKADITK